MRAVSWRRSAIGVLSAAAAAAAFLVSSSVASASSSAASRLAAASGLGETFLPYTPATRPQPSGLPRYKGTAGTVSPWLHLTNAPPAGFYPGSMNLMTNGTVLIHEDNTGTWERLTPDSSGSYVNGTWSSVASMPSGYKPLYYASQVLPSGKLVVDGGEYNGSSSEVWTNLGAVYTPSTNTWASLSPPSGWSQIGDAQSVMLPTRNSGAFVSGKMMMGDLVAGDDSILSNSTLSWGNIAGTGKLDRNDEEGWTLLPNNKVLTVDITHNWDGTTGDTCSPCTSELFNPGNDTWSATGNVPVDLPNYTAASGSTYASEEMGPVVMRPTGGAFAIGGNDATATYTASSGTWRVGPTLPNNQDSADGSASVLPNGYVLFDASPGVFNTPTHFFVSNGTSLTQVPDTTYASYDSSYVTRMMVLPTGQVMFDDGTGDIEIYNAGLTYNAAWAPSVSSISSTTLTPGKTYALSGKQLSGLDGGAEYGDDNQSTTNYPLVRLTNTSTNAVTYATTSAFSYGIAINAVSSTAFAVPKGLAAGSYTLQVVANGIPSTGTSVTVS